MGCLAAAAWLILLAPRADAEAFREDFESATTAWMEEGGDVSRVVRFHERSHITSHSGTQSERIGITATAGTHLYYGLPVGHAAVLEDLKIAVWVKADRPGIQLLARVVFPRERDPDTLELLGTLIAGSAYEQPGTWQRLELPRPDLAVERQARLLRASLKRNVDTRECYIDRMMLNVYGGPGGTELFIDDAEVSPVLGSAVLQTGLTLGQPAEVAGPSVAVSQDRLLVGGRPRLMRSIRAPGVAPTTLREFGLNALAVEWPLDIGLVEQAVRSGLWLQPQLPFAPGTPPGSGELPQLLSEMPFRDSVLCWYLGSNIAAGAVQPIADAVRDIRAFAPRRPIAADVTGDFRAYSRELDMVGAHRWPIGTALGLREYRDWLTQRRYSARPGTYFFTWIQAAAGEVESAAYAAGSGPEPDQIRLLTYAALAAGCRGIGFWADQSLGEAGMGRQRLLELGLLNLELQQLEPYLASAGSITSVLVDAATPPPKRGPGSDSNSGRDFGRKGGGSKREFAPIKQADALPSPALKEVEATLVRSDHGLLLIPVWYGKGAQFVPGQLAANDLNLLTPGIPDAAQAWQITPAGMRMLKRERVAGATRVTLSEFDLTGAVVFTSDTTVLEQLRKQVAKTAPIAAVWAMELAGLRLETVRGVNTQLVSLGHAQPDAPALVQSAEEHLAAGRAALDRNRYDAAYAESLRAMRVLRILERAHWDQAVEKLGVPQASPFATSFASLPRHWMLMSDAQGASYGENLLTSGDFEDAGALSAQGWTQQIQAPEGLDVKATLSGNVPHGGSRSLHIEVRPNGQKEPPPTFDGLTAAITSYPVPVQAGDLIRIRFWLRIPDNIRGSTEGAMVYDSIGGPALAVTRPYVTEWKQYVLYRPVPRSQPLILTLGLSGIGEVYIDDLEVERMVAKPALTQQPARPAAPRR